jgi:hypothetical protein
VRDKRRPEHPSGRPIRRDEYRRLPIMRIPSDGPVTPSLRRRELTSAIGFHVARIHEDDEDVNG